MVVADVDVVVVFVIIIVCIFVRVFFCFSILSLSCAITRTIPTLGTYTLQCIYLYLYYGNMRFLTACAIWRTHSNWFDRIKWLACCCCYWSVRFFWVCLVNFGVLFWVRCAINRSYARMYLCMCQFKCAVELSCFISFSMCERVFALVRARARSHTIDIGIMKYNWLSIESWSRDFDNNSNNNEKRKKKLKTLAQIMPRYIHGIILIKIKSH